MPVSMLVKCEKCGYENFPQHRYCGMCAAELRLPGAGGTQAAARPPRVTSPVEPPFAAAPSRDFAVPSKDAAPPPKEAGPREVSGPSFLGLGAEPAENKSFSYLLEDDTPKHRGRNVILFLLLVAGAAAAWHWRQDLRVMAERVISTLPASKAGSPGNQGASPTAPTPDTTSGTTSAASANAGTPAEKPAETTQAPTAQTPSTQAATAASSTADSTQPAKADQPPPNPSQTSEAASTPAAKPDESEEAPAPPVHARKPEMTRAQRAAASASQADELEAQGEKYLYGNGVPENCARARTNLLAAAEHSNAQAQSVLGTMYATGHCATRDLPTAYRWFGRSLRQDPKNSRIEQDLRVLWNQMTPEERQMALHSER
jgi:hypothetical protein